MEIVRKLFSAGYLAITALFGTCGLLLIIFSAFELWGAVYPSAEAPIRTRFNYVLEAIALLTIAVAALELGQTVLEEEVLRRAHMSAPTRVRRFLSRFMVVVIVSLSIESLVAVFQFSHDSPEHLMHASLVALSTAALLAAWGVFIRLNKAAETLEPEAMEQAKQEDAKLD